MKVLATIKSVEITRTFQHQDGTYGNVYGVIMQVGEDSIIAETYRSQESQKKAGIVPGAIGTATLELEARPWQDKQGGHHTAQDIKLVRFDLANRNISTDAPAQEPAPETPATEAEQGNAEGVTF